VKLHLVAAAQKRGQQFQSAYKALLDANGDIIEGQKNKFILALKHLRGSVRQRILPTSSAIIEPIPSTVNWRGNFWRHCQRMKIFLTHRSRSNDIQTRRPSETQGKQVHHNTVRLSGVSSNSIMPKRKARSMARL
jgi:hypothetical protein